MEALVEHQQKVRDVQHPHVHLWIRVDHDRCGDDPRHDHAEAAEAHRHLRQGKHLRTLAVAGEAQLHFTSVAVQPVVRAQLQHGPQRCAHIVAWAVGEVRARPLLVQEPDSLIRAIAPPLPDLHVANECADAHELHPLHRVGLLHTATEDSSDAGLLQPIPVGCHVCHVLTNERACESLAVSVDPLLKRRLELHPVLHSQVQGNYADEEHQLHDREGQRAERVVALRVLLDPLHELGASYLHELFGIGNGGGARRGGRSAGLLVQAPEREHGATAFQGAPFRIAHCCLQGRGWDA
mmetsp:Transcript_41613/g.115842  ORF Transcript_41613/g.115842 Transcript_41613/m.115842 type:complete len:295 (-) Transcript_41613:36-920(-)